jgi:hypothetical protein
MSNLRDEMGSLIVAIGKRQSLRFQKIKNL